MNDIEWIWVQLNRSLVCIMRGVITTSNRMCLEYMWFALSHDIVIWDVTSWMNIDRRLRRNPRKKCSLTPEAAWKHHILKLSKQSIDTMVQLQAVTLRSWSGATHFMLPVCQKPHSWTPLCLWHPNVAAIGAKSRFKIEAEHMHLGFFTYIHDCSEII